jgi:uncharacterized protein RhaS with RHS repeats
VNSLSEDEYGDLLGDEAESFHQYDAMANTEALLDAAGDVTRYKYTAFGEVSAYSVNGGAWQREDWNSLPLAQGVNMMAGGKKHYYLDLETGVYLLGGGNSDGGGRYYDAATGRFLSEDPKRAWRRNLEHRAGARG